MNDIGSLVGLRLHELWVTLRLLPVAGALLLAGVAVALITAADSDRAWSATSVLAVGLAVAAMVAAASAAYSVAAERHDGATAWLSLRAVPRGTLLVGWLLSFSVVIGLAGATTLAVGWAPVSLDPVIGGEPLRYVIVGVAALGASIALLALALIPGAVLRPRAAAGTAVLVTFAFLFAALQAPHAELLPGAGLALLANLESVERPVSSAAVALGVACLWTAGATLIGAILLQRVEL